MRIGVFRPAHKRHRRDQRPVPVTVDDLLGTQAVLDRHDPRTGEPAGERLGRALEAGRLRRDDAHVEVGRSRASDTAVKRAVKSCSPLTRSPWSFSSCACCWRRVSTNTSATVERWAAKRLPIAPAPMTQAFTRTSRGGTSGTARDRWRIRSPVAAAPAAGICCHGGRSARSTTLAARANSPRANCSSSSPSCARAQSQICTEMTLPSWYVGKYPKRPPAQCMSWSTPRASSGTSTPRSSVIRAFQTSGRSRHCNGAGEELPLELEPQDDVEPVGDLVRIAPDQPGPYRAHGAHERALDSAERIGERACSCRVDHRQKPRLRPTRFSQVLLCDS